MKGKVRNYSLVVKATAFIFSTAPSQLTVFGRITTTRHWEAGHWNIVSLFQKEKVQVSDFCWKMHACSCVARQQQQQQHVVKCATVGCILTCRLYRGCSGRRSKKRRCCFQKMTPGLTLALQRRYRSSHYNFFHALPTAHIRRLLTSGCVQITRKVSKILIWQAVKK